MRASKPAQPPQDIVQEYLTDLGCYRNPIRAYDDLRKRYGAATADEVSWHCLNNGLTVRKNGRIVLARR